MREQNTERLTAIAVAVFGLLSLLIVITARGIGLAVSAADPVVLPQWSQ